MLVRNPLTTYLYEFGYNSIENIHDYWLTNKDLILQSYSARRRAKARDAHDVVAFKYKIRWASHIGQFLRLAIDRRIREHSPKEPLGLESIQLKKHFKVRSLDAFSESSLGKDSLRDFTDLRGLSLLSRNIAHTTLSCIDFSYGALDSCEFIGVNFNNCTFHTTSFRHCRFIQCVFDKNCQFQGNDFSNAYVDANFNSLINEPKISYLTTKTYISLKFGRKSNFLSYSHIVNPSFITYCSNNKINNYLLNFQKLLNHIPSASKM